MQHFLRRPLTFFLLMLLCVSVASSVSYAQPTVDAKDVEQWGVEEISLHSNRKYQNPFSDVQLQGRFTSKDQVVSVTGVLCRNIKAPGHSQRFRMILS
jgi:hypothetical protein